MKTYSQMTLSPNAPSSISGERAHIGRAKSLFTLLEPIAQYLPVEISIHVSDHDAGTWILGEDQRLATQDAIRDNRFLSEEELLPLEKRDGRVGVKGLVSACPEESPAWQRAVKGSDSDETANPINGEDQLEASKLIQQTPHSSMILDRDTISATTRNSFAYMAHTRSISSARPFFVRSSKCPSSLATQNSSQHPYKHSRIIPHQRQNQRPCHGNTSRSTSCSGEARQQVTVIPTRRKMGIGEEVIVLAYISWRNKSRGKVSSTFSKIGSGWRKHGPSRG